MIRSVLRSMRNQKILVLLFFMGLILVFTTMPIAMVSLKDAMVQIEDDITEHARGSYDILVRPEGSRTKLEHALGVVEENYLSAGKGGISLNEWREIKAMNGIEIAAPVASLGYFTGESLSYSTWMPERSVRVRSQLFTSDGIHKYPIDKNVESVGILIEQESKPRVVPEFDFFSKNHAVFMEWSPPSFMLPNTYHVMAGIDPESEERLTGISFEKLHDNDAFDKHTFQFAGDASIIPVMKLADPTVPVEAIITWEELDIHKEQTSQWKRELGVNPNEPLLLGDPKKYVELFNELITYPATNKTEYAIDFKEVLKPFQYQPFSVSKDLSILPNDRGFTAHLGSTSKFYSASPINYTVEKDKSLSVKQVGDFHGVPVYRNIEEKGGTFHEIKELPFVLNPHGEYSIEQFKRSLSSSPLGIYQMAPVKLIKDQNDKILDKPIELYSTIFPGSFIPSPAHGVINITDAEIIKGEKPIDAIRVRVSGITEYNAEAQEKIGAVAKQLLTMGYEVDIVAGSSYQNMDVLVEGLGTVSQPWTTLGAAATIIKGWSGTTAILSICFMVTSIIYIWNRLYFYQKRKAEEIKLLLQFGWDTSKVKLLVRMELIFFVVLSWLFSLIVLSIMNHYTDGPATVSLFLWNGAFAALALVFMIGITERSWSPVWTGKPLPGSKKKINKTKTKPSPNMLAFKSIKFYQKFIISTIIQIILVSALTVFVILALNSTVELTNATMLGQYVNFQVNSFHFIILGSSCVIAVITLMESLFSLFLLRKNEIGTFRSIGWSHKHIFTHWLMELVSWASITVAAGHGLGFVLYLHYFSFTMSSLVTISISMTIFLLLILLIGSFVLQWFLKQSLARTLTTQRSKSIKKDNLRSSM